jgi:hypothetical protein
LRWGRGFFRGWIVISALWIGLAVIVSKPETYRALWHKSKYEIETPSGQRFTLDTSLPRDHVVEILDSELQHEGARPGGTKVEPSTRDALVQQIDDGYRAQDQALQALLATIIPPLALLLLGVAIGWVIGGFQKDKRQPV